MSRTTFWRLAGLLRSVRRAPARGGPGTPGKSRRRIESRSRGRGDFAHLAAGDHYAHLGTASNPKAVKAARKLTL